MFEILFPSEQMKINCTKPKLKPGDTALIFYQLGKVLTQRTPHLNTGMHQDSSDSMHPHIRIFFWLAT